ncbi:MAG: hypothetical protein R3C05_02895 [Pirellulaceae bacterium]
MIVDLSSSDLGEATVPASVTIPAGSDSVTFTITGVDDSIVDGTQSVIITASADTFVGATAGIDVTDDDVPTLTLSIDLGSISENGGTTTGTVTRNTDSINVDRRSIKQRRRRSERCGKCNDSAEVIRRRSRSRALMIHSLMGRSQSTSRRRRMRSWVQRRALMLPMTMCRH